MSLDIRWEHIDTGVCEQLQRFLNERISSLPLPSALRSLSIDKLDLGKQAPDIAVLDIQPPFGELYEAPALYSSPDELPTPTDNSSERLPPPPIPSPLDTQLLLHVAYKGNLSLMIHASVAVDIPGGDETPGVADGRGFISLPIELQLRGMELDVIAMVAWIGGDRICWSLLESEDECQNTSIIRSLTFETAIGDGRKKQPQSLRSIQGQVEKLLIDSIHKALDGDLVWPNYHTIMLML
ncbi:Mitochondrial distribution and morphology protein 12 [Sorochytrium milnesiophthora]